MKSKFHDKAAKDKGFAKWENEKPTVQAGVDVVDRGTAFEPDQDDGQDEAKQGGEDGWGQAWETKGNQVGYEEEREEALWKALSPSEAVWKRDLDMLTASRHPGIPMTGLLDREFTLTELFISCTLSAPAEVPRKLVT